MGASLLWHGLQARVVVRKALAIRVKAATDTIYAVLKKRVSKISPPPSTEGDYPGLVTGEFSGSIIKEFDKKKLEGRVGTDLPKAAWLEYGTPRHGPRPWLTLITLEMRKRLKSVILTKVSK